MTPHFQGGLILGNFYGLGNSIPGQHETRGLENALLGPPFYCPVHMGRFPKIVCGDDESGTWHGLFTPSL